MATKTTRKQLVALIAAGLISTLLDIVEDAASDFVEEVMDDETLVWNRLKLEITPDIIEQERQNLAHSVLRQITHDLAMGPIMEADTWEDVRDAHPRQLMLL
jgi:hypothetical protein